MVKCQIKCDTNRIFIVDLDDLKKSSVIKSMADDLGIGADPTVEVDDEVLPLSNISEMCMEKLLEWCRFHKDDPDPPPSSEDDFDFKDEIDDWDLHFLKMDDATLFDLILAANFLEIRGLLDVTTTYVARIIADLKTPEAIRQRFNIKNDLTPEDLEKIKKEAEHWLEDEEQKQGDAPEASTSAAGGPAAAQAPEVLEGAVGGV